MESSGGGEHSSGKVADWDWWSRESLGGGPVPQGLSDCAGWRPRPGLGSAPGSLQRSMATVNLLFPLAPAAGNALNTQHRAISIQHPAHKHSSPHTPGISTARLSSFGAGKEPSVCPLPVPGSTREARIPGQAQGHPRVPPRPVPLALTGGAAGPPGSGEVEEEAEEEEEKERRPRRPRHASRAG